MATKTQKTTAAQFEKKVRAAAVELEKEGIRITNAAIRERLGGGSFRDISPIVKAINAEREARIKAESEVPDMPEDVAELATAMWEAAYRAADEVAAADRRAHAEEVKTLRNEVAERENDIATVEEELDEALARADAAEKANTEHEGQLTELRVIIAGLEGRLLGRQEVAPQEAEESNKGASDSEDARQISLFDERSGEENLPFSGENGGAEDDEDRGMHSKDDGELGDEAA